VQAAGEATERSKVPGPPFSAKPDAVGDARALLGACQESVHSFSVSLPHTTRSAANGTPSIEKGSSTMHVSHSTHSTSRPFFNSQELNVLSKCRLATRVVQSCAGPGAAQGREAGEVEILPLLRGCRMGQRATHWGLQLPPFTSLTGKSKRKTAEGWLRRLSASALLRWGLQESPGNRSKPLHCSPMGGPWRIEDMVEGEQEPPGGSF